MKIIVLCLTLISVVFDVCAQKQSFKNFKRYGNWIVPAENFEQTFDSIRQEVLSKDIYVDYRIMQPTDSLVDWLIHMKLDVPEKRDFMLYKESVEYEKRMRSLGKEMNSYYLFEEWWSLIPETLVKRLKENEKNWNKLYENYFEAHAFVNNQGKILSVYFKIPSVMLDVVKEEELQMIYDRVMEKRLDIENFVFRRPTNKQVKETLAEIVGKGRSGEENWDLFVNMRRQGVPCVYGNVNFFYMQKQDTTRIPEEGTVFL
ncbi:hypothetical protein [uncultured Butyricimonas sp.]|uniref:hypothetical protein n=1 Tax=uncultured Butyricimonas sp. TaxID=1268785 RepID=UPI0026DCC2C7|nr:hypothetical protein [uncultured Butyricimonas sp.]